MDKDIIDSFKEPVQQEKKSFDLKIYVLDGTLENFTGQDIQKRVQQCDLIPLINKIDYVDRKDELSNNSIAMGRAISRRIHKRSFCERLIKDFEQRQISKEIVQMQKAQITNFIPSKRMMKSQWIPTFPVKNSYIDSILHSIQQSI